MWKLIAFVITLSAAGTLALAAPPLVSACSSCDVTLEGVASSADTVVDARVTGRRDEQLPGDVRSGVVVSPGHVTLDDCGGHVHGLPETATAAAAVGPAPGSTLPVPLLAVAALVGYAVMLRRLGRRRDQAG